MAIKLGEAAGLFRRLATGLRAGVDVRRVWQLEAGRGSPRHREHMQRIHDGVCAGHSLTESMVQCNPYFPIMVLQLVEIGEQTGRLEAVFEKLADHYEHSLRVRRSFLQSIAWPSMQLGIAILVVALLIWIMGAILPQGPDGPTDLLGFGLYGVPGVIKYFLIVGAVALGIALAVNAIARGWLGQTPVLIAMRTPVLGHCLEMIAMSRLTWALGLALESGLDARRAVKMAIRSTQNPYYTAHLERSESVIVGGGEFHEAFRVTGVYPDEMVDTLAASELAGTQAEAMQRLSVDYSQRAEAALKMVSAVAAGGVWVCVAAFIIFLIFRLAFVYLGAIYGNL